MALFCTMRLDQGGLPRLRNIEANFGKKVAKIIEGCTDGLKRTAAESYTNRLGKEPKGTLLVSAADKLYNARAILEAYGEIGARVWSRFKRGRKEQLWYFGELSKVFERRDSNRLTEELTSHQRTRATFGRRRLENPEHDFTSLGPSCVCGHRRPPA
jgi:hypothetical protein